MMNSLLGSRYLLGQMIGTGGMADVYIAQDQRLAREVAVKILRSDLARDPAFVARFRKEAKAAAGLNHPGIVAVYDSGEEPAPYIVMELVSGQTLREVIRQGERLPLNRALEIAEGILAGLEYSHARHIVHRDIKPANVMITDKGDVKVMDFGIARAMDDLGVTLTSTWNVVGTAQYLSPEQAVGELADSRSDIYSTSCLLFELLTGQPPFTGETPVSIAFQHASSTAPLVRTIKNDLPADIETVLAVALSKKPEDRYQSAQAMLDDIAKVRLGKEVTTKVVGKPFLTRRSTLILGGSFLAAIALSVTGLLMSGNDKNSGEMLPNVVGLSEEMARALLANYSVTIKRAHDGAIPKNRVASQQPLATMRAISGSVVILTVSDGPGDALVPDNLIGMSLIDARSALTAVGLLVSQTIASPSNQPQGTVLEVSPPVGSIATAGSSVILTIASGEVTVPNLIGIEAIQAKTLLIQAGFLINEFYDFDSTQPEGLVIRQAPDAETAQTIGQSVTITINKLP
jgi:eukaryotic-like serine/threonine-protein kinase